MIRQHIVMRWKTGVIRFQDSELPDLHQVVF